MTHLQHLTTTLSLSDLIVHEAKYNDCHLYIVYVFFDNTVIGSDVIDIIVMDRKQCLT